MKWVTVDTMRLKPYRCIACGSTPRDTADEARPQLQAYFAEGIDVNFGDSLYLCDSCVRVLGELRGMVDVIDHENVKKYLDRLQDHHKQLEAEHAELQARVDRMLDGVKAKKEIQGTRKRKPKARSNREPVNNA